MPNHKDFSQIELRGEFYIDPEGWEPLIIEYGYDNIGNAQFFHWRIKGTKHTFSKSVSQLNYETGGEYENSIKTFLEGFREEILGWALQPQRPDWAREYITEYNSFVKL